VFWKGEFEGKNLFFKKGFPLTARRRSQSALPRETYYNRSRWSLALTPKGLHFYNRRAARRRSQSALPRETYYNRSRWSLALTPKGLHFYNRRFSTSGGKTATKQKIDKYPFLSRPTPTAPDGKEKGRVRLGRVWTTSPRRLKSTVIEMASFQDAM
ncbi:MAG: hypothetical protein IJH67_00215, partial [Thermoguttaceae bacterium]|nr:hypothetical protein [Thermoguttaceae bacterium]